MRKFFGRPGVQRSGNCRFAQEYGVATKGRRERYLYDRAFGFQQQSENLFHIPPLSRVRKGFRERQPHVFVCILKRQRGYIVCDLPYGIML